MKDTVYTNNIGALTDSLSKMFGKPRGEFRKKFDEQKKKKNQYYTLVKDLILTNTTESENFRSSKKVKIKEVLL
jgi:cell division protein FtsI (penicillin-binding protein 3)